MAYEFDALADLEELQIEKSPDTPNTRLQIRLELQIASEPRTEHFLRSERPILRKTVLNAL
jgi:hypothetical protein